MRLAALPELTTPRLLLRMLRRSDREAIYFLRTHPHVNKYILRKPLRDPEEGLEFIQRVNRGIQQGEWYYWALEIDKTREMAGTICLWNFSADGSAAEVGFDLKPKFQGNGYMSEALGAVTAFGFEALGLHRIDAVTHKENEAARQLLKSRKFIPVAKDGPEVLGNYLIYERVPSKNGS